jgi:hypothetical protein
MQVPRFSPRISLIEMALRVAPAREDLWVGPRARAKREHWMRKPRVHAYMCVCEILRCFFWPLGQIPNAVQIHLSHNHLIGPNGATNQRAVAAGRQQVQWAGVYPGRRALPCHALPCPVCHQLHKERAVTRRIFQALPNFCPHRQTPCLTFQTLNLAYATY